MDGEAIQVDAMDVIRDSIFVKIHITRVREARIRLRLGVWIIKLGTLVAGVTTTTEEG